MRRLLRRLVSDEQGQDLVEYGLLASIVGIASLLAFSSIPDKMEDAFKSWGQDAYDRWQPSDPGDNSAGP
jgi:Flp pilus assembly pilin Flp